MPIPYGRQSIERDDIAAVVEALHSDWLTQGPEVAAFEQAFATACEAPHAVAFSSGTAALHAAAYAAGLGPGDELLTSAITFAASANCGAYLGAKPTFADIDPATWNVSAGTIESALTPATRCVVPVHFAGLPAPVSAIRQAVGDNIVIVEDAAHAIGARTPEGPVGCCRHSDMAVFSFHPVKTITSGEGGMITTRDAHTAERLREFRTHGMTKDPARLEHPEEGAWHYEQQELGFNYRLTDLQSALGRSQLAKLERFVSRRNELADRYRELLGAEERLELAPAAPDAIGVPDAPDAPTGYRHAYHLFVVRHRGGTAARGHLYDGLHARGILAQVHYQPVYQHPWYARTYGYTQGLCPNAERYYEGCLSLPCFPALSSEQQEEVAAAVGQLV